MNCYQITLENFTGKVNQCLTPAIYPYGSKGRNHPTVGETKPYLARILHELLSRDPEDGRATWQPSRGTAGLVSVPERYVAGADTRGRQEGRPYPWSQQVIHELSGLDMSGVLAYQNLSTRLGKRSLHLLAKLWHFVR